MWRAILDCMCVWLMRELYAYLVWDTHITWLTLANENLSILLVIIDEASANPNKEWSVKTVWIPIVLAWNITSWARAEKDWT